MLLELKNEKELILSELKNEKNDKINILKDENKYYKDLVNSAGTIVQSNFSVIKILTTN